VGPDPLAEAAFELQMERNSVEQLTYGPRNVFIRAAVIVRKMVQAGQKFRAERLLVPIDRARNASHVPDLDSTICDRNIAIEQAEDRSEAAFYRNPSTVTARQWRDDLRLEIAHNALLIDSLEAKYPEIC